MMRFHVTLTNEDEGHIFSEWTEDDADTAIGVETTYADLTREYGRCVSRMYRDLPNQPAKPVGWVFEKRNNYAGERRTYLQHAWVEVLS